MSEKDLAKAFLMSVLVMACHQIRPQPLGKEPSPSEVNASTFDVGLPTFVM